VPTLGGAHLSGVAGVFEVGVQEQRPVEVREDVLVYTSEPLERDTEVTGDVSLTLWAVPSAVDTDWTAMLVDVHPDGSVYNVCDDILRAYYRQSLERLSLDSLERPTSIILTWDPLACSSGRDTVFA
jgi:putative CocE/NonD family hydrolase